MEGGQTCKPHSSLTFAPAPASKIYQYIGFLNTLSQFFKTRTPTSCYIMWNPFMHYIVIYTLDNFYWSSVCLIFLSFFMLAFKVNASRVVSTLYSLNNSLKLTWYLQQIQWLQIIYCTDILMRKYVRLSKFRRV